MRDYQPFSEEETKLIEKFAGKKTAGEIAIMLGRKRASVLGHAHYKGISLKRVGQYHCRAKLSDLQAEMVKALHAAGFSDTEINKACFQHVTRSCISGITTGMTRANPSSKRQVA